MAHDCIGEGCACKKVMEYELTDEEMLRAIRLPGVYKKLPVAFEAEGIDFIRVAKAQRKKLILDIERASREGEDDKAFMMVPMSYWNKLGEAHGIEPDEVE